MKNRTILFILITLTTYVQAQKLKMYQRKPLTIVESHVLLSLNEQRAFYIYDAGCVAGKMSFAVGIIDITDKGTYSEFNYKTVSEFHAVKSYQYGYTPNRADLVVRVIDIDGDTLQLDSLVLGRLKGYALKSRKGLRAINDYNCFSPGSKTKITHFALPGFYRLFGHDVIFELPNEGMNTITIQLTIPNEFYIRDESMYAYIGTLEGRVVKMTYSNNKWSYYKSKEDEYAFYRDPDEEKEYFKASGRKPFKN